MVCREVYCHWRWWRGMVDNNFGSNYRVGFKVAAGKVEIVSAGQSVLPVVSYHSTTNQGTCADYIPPSHFRTSHPHPLQQETKSSHRTMQCRPTGQLVEPHPMAPCNGHGLSAQLDSDSPSGFGTGSDSNLRNTTHLAYDPATTYSGSLSRIRDIVPKRS